MKNSGYFCFFALFKLRISKFTYKRDKKKKQAPKNRFFFFNLYTDLFTNGKTARKPAMDSLPEEPDREISA